MGAVVRKISIGQNFPNGCMHYQVGSKVLKGKYELTYISQDTSLFEKGKLAYNLYISDDQNTFLWKTLVDLPFAIEYKIDFE